MIYEVDVVNDSILTNGRLLTAASYLKGLHHSCDRPTELMPRDATYLKSARRFYESLSTDDQMVIDSFSNGQIPELMNLQQRNKRFRKLALLFSCQMGTESKYTVLLPPKAEKGTKNESN